MAGPSHGLPRIIRIIPLAILTRFLVRLATTAVTLFGVAVIVFIVVRVVPGNPIAMMLPPGATGADIAHLEAMYGLDKSIPQQFVIWLLAVLHGDFGTSISLRQPVLGLVLSSLPATLELASMALVIAVLIGGGAALSIPDFLWGLLLIIVFGVLIPVFSISGRISPDLDLNFDTRFYLIESLARLRLDITANLLAHMVMPALSLALPLAAIIGLVLKQSLKETMELDYVTLARTKGYG